MTILPLYFITKLRIAIPMHVDFFSSSVTEAFKGVNYKKKLDLYL